MVRCDFLFFLEKSKIKAGHFISPSTQYNVSQMKTNKRSSQQPLRQRL